MTQNKCGHMRVTELKATVRRAAAKCSRCKTTKRIKATLEDIRFWCAEAHIKQWYGKTKTDDGGMDGAHPYSFHLGQVEGIAVRFGFGRYIAVRKACHMHDVFEDTSKTKADARAAGASMRVIAMAWACTDGEGATRHDRKIEAYRKINETPDAIIVKLSDRIANVLHAVETGYRRKIELYRHEQVAFRENLRKAPLSRFRDRVKVKAMWDYLEWLFTEEASKQMFGKLDCCDVEHESAA